MEPKIIILGAGISGIAAAKELEDEGHYNYLVLEGSSRVGGRIKSAQVSDYTVELGAMYVYGAGTNPVYKLLQDYNISMAEDYPDSLTVRDSSGNDVIEEASDAQSRLDEVIEKFDSDAKEALEKDLPDFVVASRWRYYGWNPKTIVEEVIQSYNCEFEFAVSPEYLSGKYAYWWAPYESFDSEDVPIVNDQRGFESLVNYLGQNFTHNEGKLRLNELVTTIKQDKDGVDILTSSGSRYHGDFVVVTVPLGVLRGNTLTFDPELPDCKRLAINGFGFAFLTQIYLMFPFAFWDDTSEILYASEQKGKYSIWFNMNVLLPGSNILTVVVWGEESRRIERLDDQIVIDEIIRHLSFMYPNHSIPSPVNYTISKWTYDPLSQGAYSYWPPSFTTDNMADMMAPFGRVHFAGEHISEVQYSYVHAAYTSGRKAASVLLKCIRNMEACVTNTGNFQCSMTGNMDCVSSATAFSKYLVQVWGITFITLLACSNTT